MSLALASSASLAPGAPRLARRGATRKSVVNNPRRASALVARAAADVEKGGAIKPFEVRARAPPDRSRPRSASEPSSLERLRRAPHPRARPVATIHTPHFWNCNDPAIGKTEGTRARVP